MDLSKINPHAYENHTHSVLLSFQCDSHCYVQINMDGFFPCSKKDFKKLLKMIMDDGEEFTVLDKLYRMLPERLNREKEKIEYIKNDIEVCPYPKDKKKHMKDLERTQKRVARIEGNIEYFNQYRKERENVIIQRLHLGQR